MPYRHRLAPDEVASRPRLGGVVAYHCRIADRIQTPSALIFAQECI